MQCDECYATTKGLLINKLRKKRPAGRLKAFMERFDVFRQGTAKTTAK